MPLVLSPSFDEHSREEIEQHVMEVQARRLSAAVEFYSGVNAKLEHESDKVQRKIKSKYESLGKALELLEKCEIKVQKYLDDCIALSQEYGLIHEMMATTPLNKDKES